MTSILLLPFPSKFPPANYLQRHKTFKKMPLWFCFVIREILFWQINQMTREEALKIFKRGYENEGETPPRIPLVV